MASVQGWPHHDTAQELASIARHEPEQRRRRPRGRTRHDESGWDLPPRDRHEPERGERERHGFDDERATAALMQGRRLPADRRRPRFRRRVAEGARRPIKVDRRG